MVVTVTVTKIYEKMNLNRWAPRNYSCTNNSRITVSDNWLRTSAVILMYKARARRNGYRMFISVYILCYCLEFEDRYIAQTILHIFHILFYISSYQTNAGKFKSNKSKKEGNDQESIQSHLTQSINGKVTNSQLDITNDSQEVSPFPAGDHKASINIRAG